MEIKTSNYLSKMKVIATFLVVMVHSYNLLGYTSYAGDTPLIKIFRVFPPTGILIFFAISGYLLFRKEFSWTENMKKKCRSLAVPFLFWNSVWMLFQICGSLLAPQYFDLPAMQGVLDWFVFWFGIPFLEMPVYAPLWFVQVLFVLNMIAPAIRWIIDRFPVWLTIVLLALAWFFPLPHHLWYTISESIVFFTIGGLIARKNFSVSLNRNGKLAAIACCVVAASAALIPGIEIQSYCMRFFLLPACVCLSVGFAVTDAPWLTRLMAHSFPIYVLHGKPLSILQVLYVKLVPQSAWTVTIAYFLLPIIIIALCVAISAVFKRCMPRFYTFVNGAR